MTATTRAAGHAATLAESLKASAFLNREADIQEMLRMNDDAPWKRCFHFCPFGADVFSAYGGGATAILQQFAQKRSEHTCMTVGACKRLDFQSLSVALRTAYSRILRSRKALVSPLSLLPQLPGSGSYHRDEMRTPYKGLSIDDDEREVLLDSPSTTTVVKNVIRHVREVLQGEFRHSRAIGPELSKTNNPTAYCTA
jgi:hypothetical protein